MVEKWFLSSLVVCFVGKRSVAREGGVLYVAVFSLECYCRLKNDSERGERRARTSSNVSVFSAGCFTVIRLRIHAKGILIVHVCKFSCCAVFALVMSLTSFIDLAGCHRRCLCLFLNVCYFFRWIALRVWCSRYFTFLRREYTLQFLILCKFLLFLCWLFIVELLLNILLLDEY